MRQVLMLEVRNRNRILPIKTCTFSRNQTTISSDLPLKSVLRILCPVSPIQATWKPQLLVQAQDTVERRGSAEAVPRKGQEVALLILPQQDEPDDESLDTPLVAAMRAGHRDVFDLLLEFKAPPNLEDYKGTAAAAAGAFAPAAST